MELAFFDAGMGGFVVPLTAASHTLGLPTPERILGSQTGRLAGIRCAVIHSFSLWDDLVRMSPEGSIRLRVSSEGFADPPAPHRDARGVYVLHLRTPSGELGESDWVRILAALIDGRQLDELIAGQGDDSTRRYFIRVEADLLTAIAILAQAYLAVCVASPQTAPEAREQIEPALRQMGWFDSVSQATVINRLKEHGGGFTDWERIRSSAWWSRALSGEDTVDDDWVSKMLVRVKSEWRSVPDSVIALIQSIGRGTIESRAVCAAYCDIATYLGGRQCR